MNVLFDTSSLTITKTGVSNYILEIIAAFDGANLPLHINEFTYSPKFNRDSPLRAIDSVYRDTIWPTFKLSKEADAICADLIHCPAFSFPLLSKKPMLITIHDIYAWIKPNDFKLWHRNTVRFYIKQAVKLNKQIVVLTEFTKQEIMSCFPKAKSENIHVVYSGIPNHRRRNTDPLLYKKILADYSIQGPYILSVSTVEPRKNFKNLLKAFSTLVHKIEHTLLVVGQNGWNNADVYRIIKTLNIEDRVRFTGFVSDEVVNNLYTHADCFVFPSFYEGFGFTPLEAMKCECPVASSNASCMPEVLGEAALYFNPNDIDDMANAILKLVSDKEVALHYQRLGIVQSGKYNWAKTADETFKIYQFIKENNL